MKHQGVALNPTCFRPKMPLGSQQSIYAKKSVK